MKKKPLEVHVDDAWQYDIPSEWVVTCKGECSDQVAGTKHEKAYGWVSEDATKNVWKLLQKVNEERFGQKILITHSPNIKFGPRGVERCQVCSKEFNTRGEIIVITKPVIDPITKK